MSDAELEGSGLLVRYTPVRGYPPEIIDRIPFEPAGELVVVNGVGRFLRVLRAGRLRPPDDPYELRHDLDGAVDLVRRCRGSVVHVSVKRRFDRTLSVWTDGGVERISRVLDFEENTDGLVVRRRGGRSALRIPRESLIRYEITTAESLEVVGIEVPAQFRLP